MAKICVILLCAVTLWARSTAGYNKGTGRAVTTHMWDCCKPTCSWEMHAPKTSVTKPVKSCAADGITPMEPRAPTGCSDGGTAYVCNDQAPFIQNGQAYAFAAARVNDLAPKDMCCSCYKLKFLNSALAHSNKTLIVQVTNTGIEYTQNHFDFVMPAGGAGLWPKGCGRQYPNTPVEVWGSPWGGITQRAQCDKIPKALRSSCQFRWEWYQNANNPDVNFERIPCPKALTDRSGCIRHDD